MLRTNIRNREGFLQGINPRSLGNHYHSYYDYKDFVLVAGTERVASLTEVLVGQMLMMEPIYILEATKGKLFLTILFTSGGVDSYTIYLYTDNLIYTYTSSVSIASDLIEIDISEELKNFFKFTQDKKIYVMAKVSNVATPVIIKGATVRVYTTAKDSFGASHSKVSKYLDSTGIISKSYLEDIQLEDEKLEYISEISDEFGSR